MLQGRVALSGMASGETDDDDDPGLAPVVDFLCQAERARATMLEGSRRMLKSVERRPGDCEDMVAMLEQASRHN